MRLHAVRPQPMTPAMPISPRIRTTVLPGGEKQEMELYQLDYILHEPCEGQGWFYMA